LDLVTHAAKNADLEKHRTNEAGVVVPWHAKKKKLIKNRGNKMAKERVRLKEKREEEEIKMVEEMIILIAE
jgi:hypothetical protein